MTSRGPRDGGHAATGSYWLAIVVILGLGAYALGQGPKRPAKPEIPHFRNTRPGVNYVGSKICATCHFAIYKQFTQTQMGNSMYVPSRLADLGWLPKPVDFFNEHTNRHYQVFWQGNEVVESEYQLDGAGKEVFRHSEPLEYVIGTGMNGATPIVRRGHYFFQAPISYYTATRSWDLSPNYEVRDFAFNLPITSDCIGCHSGRSQPVRNHEALYGDPAVIEPAIGCERCHGPGSLHVAERMAATPRVAGAADTSIVNPRKLPAWLADNICMNCHEGDIRVFRTGKSWEDFRPGTPLNDTVFILKAPIDSRSAQSPLLEHYYSMTLSKCYRASGGKLGCQSCHDPHLEPSRAEAARYFRDRCLRCHTEHRCTLDLNRRLKEQPEDACTACHMARRPALTVSHSTLTDHRIVRTSDEPYPKLAFMESLPGTGFIHVNAVPGAGDQVPPVALLKAYRKELMRSALEYKSYYFALLEQLSKSGSADPFVLSARAQKAEADGDLPKAIHYTRLALERDSSSDAPYLLLQGLLAGAGDLTASIDVLKQGIASFPFSNALYENLARVELMAGDGASAAVTVQHGLELFPEDEILRNAQGQLSAEEHIRQGMARFKEGNFEAAITELRVAIDRDPKNARAHDALGIVLGESGHLSEALAEFQRASELNPEFAEAHFHLGLGYFKGGKTEAAVEEYQQALRLNPRMVEARYGLSEICGKLGDIDGAIQLLRQVTRVEPDFAEAHYNLGLNLWNRYKKAEGLKRDSDLAEASAELRKSSELAPRQSRIFFALGQLLVDKGDLGPAVENLEKAVDLEPGNPEYHYNLGLLLRQRGDLQAAIDQFRRTLAIAPQAALAHRSLGLALRESGDLESAAAELRESVAELPGDAQGHHLLGTVLLKQNNTEAAISELSKAVELEPNLVDARASLSQALRKAGRKEEAQHEVDRLREINSEKSHAGEAMVLVQTAAGQTQKREFTAAVKTLEEAVSIDPGFTEAQFELALALKASGDLSKAEDILRQVLQRDPQHAAAHLELGLLLSSSGNMATGKDELEKALQLAPSLSEGHLALAKLAAKAQDRPTEVHELEAALAWKPEDRQAHRDLALALKASGREAEATRETQAARSLAAPRNSH